jgi:hypothetical protein
LTGREGLTKSKRVGKGGENQPTYILILAELGRCFRRDPGDEKEEDGCAADYGEDGFDHKRKRPQDFSGGLKLFP